MEIIPFTVSNDHDIYNDDHAIANAGNNYSYTRLRRAESARVKQGDLKSHHRLHFGKGNTQQGRGKKSPHLSYKGH
jgi:hypothetical protein